MFVPILQRLFSKQTKSRKFPWMSPEKTLNTGHFSWILKIFCSLNDQGTPCKYALLTSPDRTEKFLLWGYNIDHGWTLRGVFEIFYLRRWLFFILKLYCKIHWGPGIRTTDIEVDRGIRTDKSTDTGTPRTNFNRPRYPYKMKNSTDSEGLGNRTFLSVLIVEVRIPGPSVWSQRSRYPYYSTIL